MIKYLYKDELDDTFYEVDQPCQGCWIHVDEATTSDVVTVAKIIGLEYSDLSDTLDKFEVPRIERSNHHVLIFTRHPSSEELGLKTSTLTIILAKDYLVTICPHKSPLLERFISQRPRIGTAQKSKLLISILLKITQEFTIQIKRIRSNVLQQEREIQNIESEDITDLTINEENLNQYLSSLVPLRYVYEQISTGKYTVLFEEDQDLLEDLLNASIQSEDLCTINLRTIRSLRDSYQIIFTNQLNKIIKLLTSLTIILNIPTMVASLYGMNVGLPIDKNPFAFVYILIAIIALSVIAWVLFQRKKWL